MEMLSFRQGVYTNLPRDSKLVLATLSVPLAIRTIPLGRWDVTEVRLLSKFCQDFDRFLRRYDRSGGDYSPLCKGVHAV